METLLLTDQRPKRTLARFDIRVPVGFVLPEGNPVTIPFTLIVEAGVRWHPEWDEPQVTVNGWRIFHHGDALGLSGDDLVATFGALLPNEVTALALYHGKDLIEAAEAAMKMLWLEAPKAKQSLATFILPEQYGRTH